MSHPTANEWTYQSVHFRLLDQLTWFCQLTQISYCLLCLCGASDILSTYCSSFMHMTDIDTKELADFVPPATLLTCARKPINLVYHDLV